MAAGAHYSSEGIKKGEGMKLSTRLDLIYFPCNQLGFSFLCLSPRDGERECVYVCVGEREPERESVCMFV